MITADLMASQHQRWMQMAIELAMQAAREDEVPVGAVIVHENRAIGAAYNQREMLHDPTAHAEMIAITQAAEAIGDWRLENCTLYVTLEPCPMCAGAIVQARVGRVVYAATDPLAGAAGSVFNVLASPHLNHRPVVQGGVLAEEASSMLKSFFRARR